jgi:hypothetical protein
MKLLSACAVAFLVTQAWGAAISHKLNGFTLTEHPDPEKRDLLQQRVRWARLLPRDVLTGAGDVG